MDGAMEPLKNGVKKTEQVNFDKAPLLSRLVFWWTKQIFATCNHEDFKVNDLQGVYQLRHEDTAEYLKKALETNWRRKKKFLGALFSTFQYDILVTGLITLFNEVILRCTQPLLLGRLLQFFDKASDMTQKDALLTVVALITTLVLNILYLSHYSFHCYHAGLRMKSATSALLFQKLMATTVSEVQRSKNGNIINIFASDVSKFDQMLYYSHLMWSSVALSVITSALIVLEIGPDGMYGVAVVLVVCPIQSWTGTLTTKFRKKTAGYTDQRVKIMSEILAGIETIKIQVWEKPFQEFVSKLRRLELQWITRASYVRGLYMTFSIFTTRMALFITIFVYITHGNKLSADRVFVISLLYSILSNTLAGVFIRGVAELSEMKISLRRIQEFLDRDEKLNTGEMKEQVEVHHDSLENTSLLMDANLDKDFINEEAEITCINPRHGRLEMEKATASWVEGGEVTLKGVTIKAEPGSLVAVIGGVGCGKSSLLQTLLGELPVSGGRAVLHARSVSYSSQEPWIFSGSVRDNIVFGRAFERRRYNHVLRACCLLPDLKRMRNNDLTLVGERGGALSGGQKARITLARAAYAHADAYLLDEPLAALDVNVAKHVYDECVDGLLATATRVLVTNQLHLLRKADLIVVLHDGAVVAQGKYDEVFKNDTLTELIKDGSVIQQILKTDAPDRPDGDASEKAAEEQEEDEHVAHGQISLSQYLQYWMSGASALRFTILILLFVLTQALVSGSDFWVSVCIARDEAANFTYDSRGPTDGNFMSLILRNWLGSYTILVVCLFVIALARSLLYFNVARRASKVLHHAMVLSTLHAKLSFFLGTPTGRIINRFSSDLIAVDVNLPRIMLDTIQYFTLILGSFVIIFTVSKFFILPVGIYLIIVLWSKKHYLKTSRMLKRVDATMRSPIYTLLSDTIEGITSVRAFKKQKCLQAEMQMHLDKNFSTSFLLSAASTSFGFLLDVLCLVFITILIVVFVTFAEQFTSAQVGLAVTQAMSITTLLQWCVRQSAETENLMTNFERAMEFTKLSSESGSSGKPQFIPKKWPIYGNIVYKNVSLSIGQRTDILNNINVDIQSLKKVGILGRTGAGKSSLVKMLFRLEEFQGTIKIDGIDISNLPVQLLRSKISMISQNPMIFSGSVRNNLDPSHFFSDEKIYKIIQEVGLGEIVMSEKHLNEDIAGTLSVGQKQLLCVGRALLSENKILILDEATANIDIKTDALLQRLISERFQNCTVLTIAHRIHTISHCDSVIVMEKGKIIKLLNYKSK